MKLLLLLYCSDSLKEKYFDKNIILLLVFNNSQKNRWLNFSPVPNHLNWIVFGHMHMFVDYIYNVHTINEALATELQVTAGLVYGSSC